MTSRTSDSVSNTWMHVNDINIERFDNIDGMEVTIVRHYVS